MSSFVINCPELSSFVQNCPVLLLRNGTPRKTANFEAFCLSWVIYPSKHLLAILGHFWAVYGPFGFFESRFSLPQTRFSPWNWDSCAAATSSCGRESRDKHRIIHPVKTTREWRGLHGPPPPRLCGRFATGEENYEPWAVQLSSPGMAKTILSAWRSSSIRKPSVKFWNGIRWE